MIARTGKPRRLPNAVLIVRAAFESVEVSTMIDPAEVAKRRELEHRKLQRMIDYADTSSCLRATILRYFGDPAVRDPCGSCEMCRPGALDAYEQSLVQHLLSGIARAGERDGRHRIIAMLRGDTGELPAA